MYKLDKLIKVENRLYHTNDLAVLWGVSNKNTLYTTIKRYVQKGVLISIYKGLYSTLPLEKINPLELGRAVIHSYCYLSTESVLAQAGIISQTIFAHTFVTNRSKKITVGPHTFLYRRLKDELLMNTEGITNQNGMLVATPERAVADMRYFSPHYHFDVLDNVDLAKVNSLEREVGFI
jgi:predicted transcriptional regulator of viral defense system